VKAFNLAVKGLHYEIVMNGIVRGDEPPVQRDTVARRAAR
jgi:LEA14-like dessication related protein